MTTRRSSSTWRGVSTGVGLAVAAVTVIVLSWMGATGEVPSGYKFDDHWPIWRQYLTLSAVAVGVLSVLITTLPDAPRINRAIRGWFRGVGIALFVVTIFWAGTLWLFTLWGSVSVRGLTLALASAAPGLALAAGIVFLGYTRRRWSVLATTTVLLVGGCATAATFA